MTTAPMAASSAPTTGSSLTTITTPTDAQATASVTVSTAMASASAARSSSASATSRDFALASTLTGTTSDQVSMLSGVIASDPASTRSQTSGKTGTMTCGRVQK